MEISQPIPLFPIYGACKGTNLVGLKTISPTSYQIIVGIYVEGVKQQMIKIKMDS